MIEMNRQSKFVSGDRSRFVSGDRSRCLPKRVYATAGLSTIIVILCLQIVSLNKTHGGNPEHMLRLATQSPGRTDGFDGQFYLLLAQDPLLLHGSDKQTRCPVLRARRIGLPMVSRLFGLFGLNRASGLLATESLFVVLFIVFLTWAAAESRLPALLIPVAAFSLPFVLSIELVTSELPTSALLIFALYAHRKSKPIAAILLLGTACLFKEVAVLAVAACFVVRCTKTGYEKRRGCAREPDPVFNMESLSSSDFAVAIDLEWFVTESLPYTGKRIVHRHLTICRKPAESSMRAEISRALHGQSCGFLGGIILAIRLAVTQISPARLTAVMGALLVFLLRYGGEAHIYNEIFNFGRQLFLLPVGLLAVTLLEQDMLQCRDRKALYAWICLGGFLGLSWWIHHLAVRGHPIL